jgi:cephalosporin-C deacetylase
MDEVGLDLPEDFQRFWEETTQEANECPLDYHRSKQSEVDLNGFFVEKLEFRASDGRVLSGWIAYQAGAFQDPGFLWVAPYGRESMLPNEYGTRHGFVSLSFNFHGHPAFYLEKYERNRGYFAEGADSPATWIFRRMFQDSVIAARVLADLPETDPNRLGSMGMSQGAGISIWLGAWCSLIRSVCADMPFLGLIGDTIKKNVYRYPLKELTDYMAELPLGEARVANTVSYFDTSYHAQFCHVPTQVSLGLRDPAATPEQVRSIFEALSGHKQLKTYDIGHDWNESMIDNNRNWFIETLR